MLTKELFGIIAVVLTFLGYVPYFHSIYKRQTRPHMFSWIIWTITNGIACAGQFSRGGGAGSWTAGVTMLLSIVVVVLSISRGEKHVTRSDWIAFIVALAAVPLWYFTHDPLGAVILATLTDVIGGYPTIRKSYHKPYEENVFSWGLVSLRSFVSLFALEHYSAVTLIFPITMFFANAGVVLLLLWRRTLKLPA